VEGSEKEDLRMDKKVKFEVEDSELEESASGNTQGLLTSAAYDILSVLIKTHGEFLQLCQLEVEKEQLDVEWGRAVVEWECMLHLWNVAALQHYMV